MIYVNWIDEQHTVLCLEYEHPVSDWDEYLQANARAYDMMQTVPQTVHLIHHAGDVMMPRGNPFPHLRYVYNHLPDNAGRLVMVINHRFPRVVINISLRFMPEAPQVHLVETMDEARRILNLDTDTV